MEGSADVHVEHRGSIIFSKLICTVHQRLILGSLYASNSSSVICVVPCYGSAGKIQIFAA